ncbi:DUF167 domain-containing protein [Geopsychrobacter electrodiphilus]|uniref:DUF167 domain-containing protein n=1 Tax=Geopsychrobacter electrodiphilus TaxID=225196 RepID=UPI00035C4DA5|nr:DUF167 domain-containing protein [Geopsychrobacter electrodiphilus]
MLDCLKAHAKGTVLSLHVQPRSSRNQIVGLHGERLKLKLTSPPVEGSANKCCCDYLAKLFKLSKSDIELISGDKARQKRILLHGLDPQSVAVILMAELSSS